MLLAAKLQLGMLVFGSVAVTLAATELAIGYIVPLRDVGPSFSRYDPLLGQSLRPSFSTVRTTPEFTMRLSTNAHGFRGPEPDSGALPRGAILFLGDSFTMGYGVNDGEEFPALVAAMLKQTAPTTSLPVINAGVGASGNGRWVKLIDSLGATLAPRAIVMQVLDNDFDDNQRERLFELAPDGGLRELPVPAPGLGRKLQSAIEAVPGLPSSNLIALLRQVRFPPLETAPRSKDEPALLGAVRPGDELTLRILEKAIVLCRGKGWPVLGLSVGLEGARNAAIRKLFIANGTELLELPGKAERPEFYYRVDGHWNAAGHNDAANRVFERLVRMGFVNG